MNEAKNGVIPMHKYFTLRENWQANVAKLEQVIGAESTYLERNSALLDALNN